jgi:4'-phosphopantetheinyl transferase
MDYQLSAPQIWGKELTATEVHIWYASLDKPVHRFHKMLSADERKRAGGFHFERDWQHYIVRRGTLRTILGCYLHTDPRWIEFEYGENEKPALADNSDQCGINFSTSHSQGLALYAFTLDREVGVDIEFIRDHLEMEMIVERFYSDKEKTAFRELPAESKKEAFFKCWTRKEAFIKATGNGMSKSLDSFEVSLNPGEPARLLEINGDPAEASRWTLHDLKPSLGYAAAFAVVGECNNIHCWNWTG